MKHLAVFPTYGPIIDSLLDIGVETDIPTIKAILGLLKKLREKMIEGLGDAKTTEERRIKEWTTLKGSLTKTKAAFNEKVSSLEMKIETYLNIIKLAITAEKTSGKQAISFTGLLTTKRSTCIFP